MSQGTVGWWVIGLYLRAVGVFLTVAILLSLILMQLSQNFTFLWLTFWVKNRTKNSTSVDTSLQDTHENSTLMDHGFNVIDNVIHSVFNTSIYTRNSESTVLPLREQFNVTPVYNDNFYLEMYFGLAGLNLLFTIMRAFLFAYGGVKAAAKVHKTLLKVIVKVCWKNFNYIC